MFANNKSSCNFIVFLLKWSPQNTLQMLSQTRIPIYDLPNVSIFDSQR